MATDVTAAAVADAAVRLGLEFGVTSPHIRAAMPGSPIVGPARPVIHAGSVDVFLEAIHAAAPGEVLVIDNGGRTDEACIGDLTVLEAKLDGIAAMIVWGCHRDSAELRTIDLPVWSLGATPVGPRGSRGRALDPFAFAQLEAITVRPGDIVVADDDGVVVVTSEAFVQILPVAREIVRVEREQADRVRAGQSLWAQLGLDEYLERRSSDPTYDLRRHLAGRGGAIET